jgi:uncharacterized protein with HEPN domain
MPERSSYFLLLDILDAVQAIREYTGGMSFEQFIADKKTVMRSCTISKLLEKPQSVYLKTSRMLTPK